MFMDKQNLYSIFFLLAILFLVLFFSRFSFLEGLEGTTSATPVVNATPTTKPVKRMVKPAQVVKPIAQPQPTTTTPVIQATSSPMVTTNPTPTSAINTTNLASLMDTQTISTATIVKISDIQAQVTNLLTILQKDVATNAIGDALKLREDPDFITAISTISEKPIIQQLNHLADQGIYIYKNLESQTMQIQANLINFKNQYQNL